MPPEAGGRVYGVKMENNAVGLEIESYPFDPVLPNGASVMMMGTFPPKEDKRAMQFHYPNFQNDMWRVYGLVFFNDAAHFQMPSEKAFGFSDGICPQLLRYLKLNTMKHTAQTEAAAKGHNK